MVVTERARVGGRELVNQWLAAMGREAGLRLQLDDDGLCGVGHVGGLDCALEVPDETCVVLRTPLMPWRSGVSTPALAEHCLKHHFLGVLTDGASLAIDPVPMELVLWKAVPLATLDEASFARLLADFLSTALQCRDDLLAWCEGGPESSATNATNAPGRDLLSARV